jgi:hypothetical protein
MTLDSRRGDPHRRVSPAVATLVFDTFRQTASSGVLRSGTSGSRHLLYRAGDLAADLRLECSARRERILLIGQVADACRPSTGLGDVRLSLLGGADELATLDANDWGEFQCEFERREDLTLSVVFQDRAPILIPLDRLPLSPTAPAETQPPTENP